jgi:hypothetical protein
LDVVDATGNPTLESIRASILIQQALAAARGDAVARVLAVSVVQNAFNAGLDLEPPSDMPRAEMLERVRVWACCCMLDWFTSMTSRRHCMIGYGNEQSSPSFLFSNASWEMATVDGGLWPIELKVRAFCIAFHQCETDI